jgi:hypothetical protein
VTASSSAAAPVPTIRRSRGSAPAAADISALRCRTENEVASPVVPQIFSPSQPLSSSQRQSATKRSRSGSKSASIGVAAAAITPRNMIG